MNWKALYIDCLIVAAVMLLVLSVMSCMNPVQAMEMGQEAVTSSTPLFELLSTFVGGDQAAQWLGMLGLVCYIITQILPWVPKGWLEALPGWVTSTIEYLAGNYRGTKNATVISNKSSR